MLYHRHHPRQTPSVGMIRKHRWEKKHFVIAFDLFLDRRDKFLSVGWFLLFILCTKHNQSFSLLEGVFTRDSGTFGSTSAKTRRSQCLVAGDGDKSNGTLLFLVWLSIFSLVGREWYKSIHACGTTFSFELFWGATDNGWAEVPRCGDDSSRLKWLLESGAVVRGDIEIGSWTEKAEISEVLLRFNPTSGGATTWDILSSFVCTSSFATRFFLYGNAVKTCGIPCIWRLEKLRLAAGILYGRSMTMKKDEGQGHKVSMNE